MAPMSPGHMVSTARNPFLKLLIVSLTVLSTILFLHCHCIFQFQKCTFLFCEFFLSCNFRTVRHFRFKIDMSQFVLFDTDHIPNL